MSLMVLAALAAVAATPAPARAASPAPEARAQALVERLYVVRKSHAISDKAFQPLVAAPLWGLLQQDVRQAHGEVGALDGDPFCQCQDDTGFTHKVLSTKVSGDTGLVVVRNRFQPPATASTETVTYHLVRTAGAWRLADIESKDQKSLAGFLSHELRGKH